ncbi:MAG: hypothetical protein ABI137_01000 [Antricoccus sp.]
MTKQQRAAIASILNARATGVLQHDQQKFLTGLPTDEPQLANAQQVVYANLQQLPVASWSYTLKSVHQAASTPSEDRAVTAEVMLSYQLTGFDAVPDTHHITMTFVERGGKLWLRDPDAGLAGSWHGIWDDGPISVAQSSSCLVIATQKTSVNLGELGALCDGAVAAVSAVWGPEWAQRAVLLMPDRLSDLRALGTGNRNLQNLSALAVATSVDVPSGRVSGARILLNAQPILSASVIALQVLLTHEVTHVAARAVTRAGTPLWLQEGFADFVGYQSAQIKPPAATATAAQLLAEGPPSDLPGDDEITGSGTTQEGAYEYAWLAMCLLDAAVGQPALVAMYRQIAMSSDPEMSFNDWLQSHLSMTRAQFISAWISYVKSNAAA